MTRILAVGLFLLATNLGAQTRPTTKPIALGPAHLAALNVPLLEPAVAWYRDILGFVERDKKELPEYHLRIAMLEHEGFWLEIVQKDPSFSTESIQKNMPEIKDWDSVQGIKKLAFTVSDLDATVKLLKDRKVKFVTPSVMGKADDPVFGRSVIVLDNYGNWIQFCEIRK